MLQLCGTTFEWNCRNLARNRRGKEQNNNDYSEADITPASYRKGDSLINGVVGRTTDGGDKTPETSPDHDVSSSSGGWYINSITPIGMVSSNITLHCISDGVSWNNKNPILVTCDSIGGLSIINANKMNVVAQYETFMADSDATASTTITTVGGTLSQLLQLLPLPSSSKNNPCNIGTLTYTKGTCANVDIATCLAINSSSSSSVGTTPHVAVGGRERGTCLVNVITGAIVWKAKNLPPDSQALLQRMM